MWTYTFSMQRRRQPQQFQPQPQPHPQTQPTTTTRAFCVTFFEDPCGQSLDGCQTHWSRQEAAGATAPLDASTVAMELAAALHHSCGVSPDATHKAIREQTLVSSEGWRPGVLKEPEPPAAVEHAVCPCSGAPSLVVPTFVSSGEGIDSATLSFLVKAAVLAQAELVKSKKDEEEEAARRAMKGAGQGRKGGSGECGNGRWSTSSSP